MSPFLNFVHEEANARVRDAAIRERDVATGTQPRDGRIGDGMSEGERTEAGRLRRRCFPAE